MSKAMLSAGYSKQSSRSGVNYANIRKNIAELYDPERVKADIVEAEHDFKHQRAHSCRSRMIELRARVSKVDAPSAVNVNIIHADSINVLSKYIDVKSLEHTPSTNANAT